MDWTAGLQANNKSSPGDVWFCLKLRMSLTLTYSSAVLFFNHYFITFKALLINNVAVYLLNIMVGTISFRRPCSCKPPTYENSFFFHQRKCAYICFCCCAGT